MKTTTLTTHGMTWLLAAALGGVATGLRADGYRNPPDGPLALGRIGGRVVDIDDATAVSHNPANLVSLRQLTIQPAVTLGYSEKKFTAPDGRHTLSEDPWRLLPSAYAAVPIRPGALALGVGLNVPFGQATRWDDHSLFRYTAPYYAMMRVVDLSPAVALRVHDRLAVGLGMDLYRGDLKFEQYFPWSLAAGNPAAPDGVMTFAGDDYAVGGHAGVTVKLTESQRLAATYQLPFDMDYAGDFDLSHIPSGAPAVPSSAFNTTIKYPQIAALGYSLRVTERVRLEANVEWLNHARNETMGLDIGANTPMLQQALGTTALPQDWKNTWTFGLGGDWQFLPRWQLRAGYLYMPTPVPQHSLMPSAAEQDQSVVSLGLGYRRDHHAVDLALAQGLFRGREVRGNQNPAYNGDYDFRSTLLGLSYQYAF